MTRRQNDLSAVDLKQSINIFICSLNVIPRDRRHDHDLAGPLNGKKAYVKVIFILFLHARENTDNNPRRLITTKRLLFELIAQRFTK